MNRIFNKINNNINKKRRKYSKELLKTSKYFEEGKRKCKNNREKILCCLETLVQLILMNLIQDKKR